jgi:sugar phosphate isomerase/epimerase
MVAATQEHLERILSYGLQRVELVILPQADVPRVREIVQRAGLLLSIHSPLCRDVIPGQYPLLASLLDTDDERREGAVRLMEDELIQARDWGATHLTVHLQRSVAVLGEALPAGWDAARALDVALHAAERLAAVAQRVGVTLHIENMMGNALVREPEFYVRFFEALAGAPVRMCFDVGHAAFDAAAYGFTTADFAAALAPYIGSLHVYNNQVDDEVDFAALRESGKLRKHPVHPGHQPEEGWIDMAAVLDAVLSVNPEALVTFEVYFSLDVDRDATREGLDWTAALCRRWWG